MIDLPQKFRDEMQELLGDEYPDFLESYQQKQHSGLRMNTLKITPEDYLVLIGESLKPVPWNPLGFYYDGSQTYSKNPLYHAGLYYIQEPSAMRPAELLPVKPGDKVLDLCAAPGGKSTALGAKLCGQGLLVSNDVSASRAKALLKNIEYFGIINSLILSEQPHKLAEHFPEYFDKVLIDAPCSGEGMFRKKPSMTTNWEKFGPEYFGQVQRQILLNGADMLAPGGMMVYSTCTFSSFENEDSIQYLMEHRPEMSCISQERFWPHRVEGEGHFCALLKKAESAHEPAPVKAYSYHPAGELTAFEEFLESAAIHYPFNKNQFVISRESLYYFPQIMPDLNGLHIIRNGWYLGELKKKRFEPSGSFARALHPSQSNHVIDLKLSDIRVKKYLKCETIEWEDTYEKGWYLVCCEGYPLGFGKLNQGVLKNKYPVGWRWN